MEQAAQGTREEALPRGEPQVSVLFICTGNICRSPTAEAVFRQRIVEAGLEGKIVIDSAGTHSYHVGEPPDRRAQLAAKRRGYDLSRQRARQLTPEDCQRFDYLIVMDSDNHRIVQAFCPEASRRKLHRLLAFAPDIAEVDVPDPYYGGEAGFERVLDMIEAAADGLLLAIECEHFETTS
jgi:protein-tyrosine phosphatase